MYGNETALAARQGAQLGADVAIRVNRVDGAVNTAGNLCEGMAHLVGRLEALGARLLGNGVDPRSDGSAKQPTQPVRPAVAELEHRQEVIGEYLSRAMQALSRIEEL